MVVNADRAGHACQRPRAQDSQSSQHLAEVHVHACETFALRSTPDNTSETGG